jgi:hypothetical protein
LELKQPIEGEIEMNEQFNTSDFVERTDADMNNQVVNSDPFAEKALNQEAPIGGAVNIANPMDEKIAAEAPMGEAITKESPIGTNAGSSTALLNREESEHFRTRWNEIQGKFVDEPRAAVEQADTLVSEVIEQITQTFTNEHSSLENQWNQGNDVSTEDLRKALQRYRSFFNRLVV